MSATKGFAAGFLLLVGVTLLIPSFPPARLLCESLKIQPPTLSVWGMPVAMVLNGFINGFFWVLIAAAVYGVACYIRGSRSLAPMPVAPILETPPPEPMVVDDRVNRIPPLLTVPRVPIAGPVPVARFVRSSTAVPSITVRTDLGEIEQDIETIEGVSSAYGRLLRNLGINSVKDLLRVGAREDGRRDLAEKVGVPYWTLLKWVCRGDLLRVRGVGKKYSALLELARVNSVTDLSTRNARNLFQTLMSVNRERNVVRRTPPVKTIEIWVNFAKTLEPIVE